MSRVRSFTLSTLVVSLSYGTVGCGSSGSVESTDDQNPAVTVAAATVGTTVNVSPPSNARFWPGQKFDIRVEGDGEGPYSATVSVDGVDQTFSSGAQGTVTTDGISAGGWGGFNLRGFSIDSPGTHTIEATFTNASGTTTASSTVTIADPRGRFGGRGGIKNIIIMLGDGMGVGHRTAARIVRYGVAGGDPNGWLEMDQFPTQGMVTTHSLNSIVTDSAPGMSCYVTGNHQNNNQEGVFPSHVTNAFYGPRVEYLSEYMHRTQGKVLGIVTTADVEDATPAANAVHTANRGAGTGIVDQYFDEGDLDDTRSFGSGLRVLLGGGRRWFLPASQSGSSRASNDYPPIWSPRGVCPPRRPVRSIRNGISSRTSNPRASPTPRTPPGSWPRPSPTPAGSWVFFTWAT